MAKEILFIHGGSAFSRHEDYLEYLRTTEIRNPLGDEPDRWSKKLPELFGESYTVYTPQMPNKQNAKYLEWQIWFERHLAFLHDNVVLIGWSLGGWFLVKYLLENELSIKVKALYLLAAPFCTDDFGGEDGGDFTFEAAQLPGRLAALPKVVLMHSRDDFVVPFSHCEQYQQALPNASTVIFTDKNHFLQSDFPELIEAVASDFAN